MCSGRARRPDLHWTALDVRVRAKTLIPPERLAEIERKLLNAEAAADFVPELAARWGRSERSLWDYVARVRARLAERAKAARVSPEADAEIVRSMLLETYRDARTAKDRKVQVAAAYRYAEVTGAKAAQKIDVTSGGASVAINLVWPDAPAPAADGAAPDAAPATT